MFFSHLYVFFGEVSIYAFCPLVYWVDYFSGIELHELLVYFGDQFFVSCFICYFFSYTEGCLFTLFIDSFVVQKLLSYLGLICLFLLFSPFGF